MDLEAKKEANRKYQAAWRLANPEKVRLAREKYRASNPERFREARRRSRNKWRLDHPESARESSTLSSRRWRAAHPEEARRRTYAAGRKFKEAHREELMLAARKWREENPEKSREKALSAAAKRRASMLRTKAEKVDLFLFRVLAEPICGICGKELDKNSAEIDHIIPLSRGGGHVWGNLQLAHKVCNRGKGAKLQDIVYSI